MPASAVSLLALSGVLAACGTGPDAPAAGAAGVAESVVPGAVRQAPGGVPPRTYPEMSRRVLVVINDGSPDSRAVGEHYVKRRMIPPSNVVRINVSAAENVTFDEYRFGIETPVRRAIERNPNAIDFIVTTRGVPLRLRDNDGYSVDGHLAAMNLTFEPLPDQGTSFTPADIERTLNPYRGATERFSSRKFGMYLVTRLDAYTLDEAKSLVDRSINARRSNGPFLFDMAGNRKSGGYGQLNEALRTTGDILARKGFTVVVDEGEEFAKKAEPLAGYAGWGSNDAKFDLAAYRSLRFHPGAIAETFVSTSGRTFRPTEGGQSLIADLIAQGVTGVKGYVSEPFTFALARPELLFDRYTAGWTLAESFYAASMVLKWKDVVIGDPICAPYAPDEGPV